VDCSRKALAQETGGTHPALITASLRVARLARGECSFDTKPDAWGRNARVDSIQSARARQRPVSTTGDVEGVDRGVRIEDFTVRTCQRESRGMADLWKTRSGMPGDVSIVPVHVCERRGGIVRWRRVIDTEALFPPREYGTFC